MTIKKNDRRRSYRRDDDVDYSHIRKARLNFLDGIGVPQKSEFKVDDFQQEAIDSVVQGYDTLVIAPTGSGKTFIAIEAIEANAQQGLQSIYTTPLKALSNTKFTDFKNRFEPRYKVGLLTGDRKIDTDADIVIATTEIYRNELYRIVERFSLVVLDEVHYIADQQRGAVWEESIILSPKDSALLMLSASISNANEIAAWIQDVRGKECRIITKKERPVELRYGFLHPDLGVLPLCDEKGKVFNEITRYYGSAGLDASGTRILHEKRGSSTRGMKRSTRKAIKHGRRR